MTDISDFSAIDIEGRMQSLRRYAGQVVLIVNTASKCGFTGQYAGLQELHATYASSGFAVLGFPCNQFLGQEPGTDAEIASFCSTSYNVAFPMFQKIEVNGPGTHPLYGWLKEAAPGVLGSSAIKWNFTKFLVDRSGQPIVRYAPTMEPRNIASTIERLLRQPAVPRDPTLVDPAQH